MTVNRLLLVVINVCMVAAAISSAQTQASGAPGPNNFAYPQSLFVDSRNGHLWVTDFDHHRVLRFDVSTLTAIEREIGDRAPKTMMLSQNYPNPFNPQTQISFSLAEPGRAKLSVSNLLGQEIAVLFHESVSPGTVYSVSFNATHLSSGIYLYTLRSADGVIVKRMCVIK